MSSEFESRLLYTQISSAIINEEEPVTVSSTTYAIRFLFPGASQHTTSRLRITCTYRESEQFEAHAGVIERWSDKGWILMDDYTDDIFAFHSEEEFRKRLLGYAHSFVLGIPLTAVDKGYVPDSTPPVISRKSTPKKMFDIEIKDKLKTEKKTEKKKDIYKKTSSKDDDDDIDWL